MTKQFPLELDESTIAHPVKKVSFDCGMMITSSGARCLYDDAWKHLTVTQSGIKPNSSIRCHRCAFGRRILSNTCAV